MPESGIEYYPILDKINDEDDRYLWLFRTESLLFRVKFWHICAGTFYFNLFGVC